jgi:arylsulfatase A-like enzyme
MLVRGPGVPAGVTNPSLVANIDLAPTFAELASVQAPDFVDGRSLTETFAGGESGREALLIEIFGSGEPARPSKQGKEKETRKERKARESTAEDAEDAGEEDERDPFRAIRTADWLYVEYGIPVTGSEMYDLQSDPSEITSLSGDPAHAATEAELAAWLHTLQDCAADTCRQAENARPR